MALCYCSLHTRLLSCAQQRWMPFPEEKIRESRGYYALLCSTDADPSFLKVIEMSCDQCAATFRTRARVKARNDWSSE